MNERPPDKLLDWMEKYSSHAATEEERAAVDRWYVEAESAPRYLEGMSGKERRKVRNRLLQAVELRIGHKRPRRWLPYAAAAVLLFTAGIAWIMIQQQTEAQSVIAPGGLRATLSVSDGSTFVLDEHQEGIVVTEEGMISYADGTSVVRQPNRTTQGQMLTLSTPRGGTYRVTLPDSSVVWLNAGSSLKYPHRFDAKERRVELEGEAYFSVRSAGRHQPFRVASRGQVIEVIGTEFNVSVYAEDPVSKTTLAEGKVRWSAADASQVVELGAGEQLSFHDGVATKATVDVRNYISWKSGDFYFHEEPLESVLRQLARWYDVEIEFSEDAPRNERIGGKIARNKPLQEVLKVLEDTGAAQFSVEGRTILVSDKK